MKSQKLVKELQDLIEKGLEHYPVPYVKGNSIRIGAMVVRTSKHGNLVYDTVENKKVAHCVTKSAAIAIARTYKKDPKAIQSILHIDDNISKHLNDAMFYKHGMKTADDMRYDILETRLDISLARARNDRAQLDKYIYF